MSLPVVLTFEPGATAVGRTIRRILLDSRNRNLTPLAELLLYAADRSQHVEEVVKPALKRGRTVVCDRFLDATTVYQGYARGQDMQLISALNAETTGGLLPDITFLLDCPAEVGLERALRRNADLHSKGQDRFEREELQFHKAVREGYLLLAREYAQRFVVLNGTLPVDETESQIVQYVKNCMRKPKP
jgi:dTMP kinase